MHATILIGSLCFLLTWGSFASGQRIDEDETWRWTQSMIFVSVRENTPNNIPLFQLEATYKPNPSAEIVYGLNLKDILKMEKQESGEWGIYPNGTVVLVNSGAIDREGKGQEEGVKITFYAVLRSDATIYSEKTRTVNILDDNDNDPEFLQKELRASVVENTVPPLGGTKLITGISITDADTVITNGRYLQCSIVKCQKGISKNASLSDCDGNFEIRPQGGLNSKEWIGDFYIMKPLNYEDGTVWQVVLQAFDGLHRPNQDVTIDIIDVQDVPPVWLYIPIWLQHPDETPENYNLGYVLAEDGDGDIANRRPIHYSLIPTIVTVTTPDPAVNLTYRVEDYFRIDENTGVIYNKVKLDLESEPFSMLSSWPINVKACEVINSTHIGTTVGLDCTDDGQTTVRIVDINDNRPEFNTDIYEFTISEDVRNGENLELPNNRSMTVFDKDSDLYNAFTVRFEQPSDEFQLSSQNMIGTGIPIIQVKNTSLIDFDPPLNIKQYRLMLIAVDDNDNRLRTSATVLINVIDANDNQPIFKQNEYRKRIREDAPEGTTVTTIQADDIDTGLMGTAGIRYSFAPGNPHANLFEIHPETGIVTVAKCDTPGVNPCLDYEFLPNKYNFKVAARDELGTSQRTSYATLIIDIDDVNDNPPQVGDYIVDIFENQTITKPPLKIVATDADKNDVLSYSIVAQPIVDGIAFWQIDSVTGDVTATRPIKYEYAPRDGIFELQVEVTDGERTAISFVTINVLDINDNAPRFQPVRYVITIPESTPGDVYLLDVFAKDDDDPTTDNGKIDYSIERGGEGQFRMENNGSMFTSRGAKFNYVQGQRNEYTVIVVATDRGSPVQLSGSGTVIVRITDENNEDPSFVPFSRRFQVRDDAPFNTPVAFLTAKDPDQDPELRFYLEAKEAITPAGQPVDRNFYDFTQLFRIDEITAQIFVNAPLDHNKASVVTLDSIVRDIAPLTPQEGRGTVIIDILKVNKKPPVFANYSKEFCLPEEQAKGTYVTSFIATDEDGAVAEFQIVEQPDDYFTISPQNGFVTINKAVDYDDERKTNGSYFVVTVTDIGTPTLTSTASVSVCFTNINDNYPVFTENGKYVAEIDENLPDGEKVVQVFASDADRRDEKGYADIRYRMDDNRFDVEPETGWIYVRRRGGAELDRELTPTLVVQVIGYDTPNGPESVRKQRVASVIITLRDVNDNIPVFTDREYEERIYEIIRPSTKFLTLYTTDEDLGLYGKAKYRKVPGVGNDTRDFFDVNPFGEIFVKRSVQGYVDTYKFQVEARDEDGQGPFSSYANVTVHVLPAGNTAPIWVVPPRDNETIYVLEEQYNGMFIYDVSARDVDTGMNGVIDYMFVDGGEETQKTDAFQINPTTGVIHAEIIYDRETTPKYVLLLKAKDRGETRLEATRFLTIVILDVNDNKPQFKETEMLLRVREDVPIGTEVKDSDANKKIVAEDKDENPVIKYAIISGNEDDAFYLNEDTAKLYTNKILNTKIKSIYNLDIQAYNPEPDYTVIRDRKKRAVDPSILKLKVLVGAINDEAPVFLGEPYYGCVSTRSSFDKSILTVSAVDYDAQGAGIVRYTLKDGPQNSNNQPIFGIDESFGILTNKVLMRNYADRIYNLNVNARDREDAAVAEDANTTVTVYVTQPGKEAKLLITQNTAEVRLYQTQIQRIIEASNLSQSDPGTPWRFHRLCINTVRDHVINTAGETSPVWSDVYISGIVYHKDTKEMRIVSALELKNIIMTEMHKRPTDFNNLYIRTVEDESSEETSVKRSFVLVVVIIIAILIFLALLFIILAYFCIRAAKQEKKSRLIHRTQAAPAPVPVIIEKQMEPAAVFEAQEPVVYDNRAYVVEAQSPPPVVEPEAAEPEPVHITYAVVDKSSRELGPTVIQGSPDPVDTDDVIIVSQFRDDPVPAPVVYQVDTEPKVEEDEYRIVTETM